MDGPYAYFLTLICGSMSESTTLRLHDRRTFRRALSRLELEHDVLWDAQVADIHTAMVWIALDNPDLLIEKVDEVQRERVTS